MSGDERNNSLSLSGPTSSDFEAVLGRVGLDANETNQFSVGTPDEEPQGIEFPPGVLPELANDGDMSYGLPSEQEEKMLAAALSDLVKLLHLPVRFYFLFFIISNQFVSYSVNNTK